MAPNFSALFELLDRVLCKWDKARETRRKKKKLRRRADEILKRHTEVLKRHGLRARDQQELADIMRIADQDERCRRLVEFDDRTRY